MSNLYYLNGDV